MSEEAEKMAELSLAEESRANVPDGKLEEATDEDVVNPWDVQASSATGIDYDKLISKLVG